MAIKNIVTKGIGVGGTPALIVTHGFSISANQTVFPRRLQGRVLTTMLSGSIQTAQLRGRIVTTQLRGRVDDLL